MATHNHPPQSLSLQELCVRKLLEQILRSNTAYQVFSSLPPRAQRLLFDRLKANDLRLRDVDENWSLLTRYCPRIDTQIYLEPMRYPLQPMFNEHIESPYILDWRYNKDDVDLHDIWDQHRRRHATAGCTRQGPIIITSWSHGWLFSSSPHSDFQICRHSRENDPRAPCPVCQPDGSVTFEHRISPQLLLYRLITTYGMPQPITPSYEDTSWTVILKHLDGISLLALDDDLGEVKVVYSGLPQASDSALGILNYLVGLSYRPLPWPLE